MVSKVPSFLLVLAVVFHSAAVTGYRTEGFPCRAHFQCESGYCNNVLLCENAKANAAACDQNEACQSKRCSGGVCQVQRQVGDGPCDQHADCLEGYCNPQTKICDALKPKQDSCGADYECNSGRCFANPPRCEFVIYEGQICGKDSDCYGGRCKFKELGGDNRCYPRKWNLEKCNHNSDCLSLRCETQNCTEPVWLGEPCDEPSDCYSLFCNTKEGKCVKTAEEADTNEIEPEAPGIVGSNAQASVNGGGSVDIDAGEILTADGEVFESSAGNGGGDDDSGASMTTANWYLSGLIGAMIMAGLVDFYRN